MQRIGPHRCVFLRALVLSAAVCALSGSTIASAQGSAPWQAAEEIRELGFEAQDHLYAAERAERTGGHYDSAAALLAQAGSRYVQVLQPDLSTLAPDADRAAVEVLDEARAAAAAGDAPALAAARGQLWATLLRGSYTAALGSLSEGDIEGATRWLRLREYRDATKVATAGSGAARALAALQDGRRSLPETVAAVENDLRDAYSFRLRDALTSLAAAAEKGFATRAAEWAGLASGYFEIVRGDFAKKRGDDAAAALAGALAALEEAAVGADWRAVDRSIASARLLLADYQPVDLTDAELAERATLLHTFLDLVYVEYRDGVRDGEITSPIEYQEARTFLDQAQGIFEELRSVLVARDSRAAERLEELLAELQAVLADLGETERVEQLVGEALLLVETTFGVEAETDGSAADFTIIDTLLDELLAAARQGRYEEAERARVEAYAVFESGPELSLVHRAPVTSRELEGLFWEGAGGHKGLATLLREEAAPGEIEASAAVLKAKLADTEGLLAEGVSGISAATQSAVIILREGLEAVLIVGAILGYLRATRGPRRYTAWIYAGVLAAILLSVLTWWAAQSLISISVSNRELVEGIASLLAVAVLFYVTNWLFHKVYILDWMTFIKGKVGKAVTSGSALALAALGFTVVYREGFETALFYQALLFDAEPMPVLLGFLVGSAVVLAIAYAILRLSVRLPLKAFFTVTGLLLLVLAFSLTGAGIRELQEAGVVNATLLDWVPENALLMETLGIFPTVETTLAQALFLLLVAATFAYSRWRAQRTTVQPGIPAGGKGA
ncbi:MAG: FTR1 family iron permease [Chloroflexi bacterium]|nr:FTR1 family iron permease [Chloroflexota bacterium]